jgi:tetratricopeptide (TPR) repeat protein
MKNKKLVQVSAVCALFLLSFNLANAQTAQQYLDAGNDLFKNGQYDEAIADYNKALKLTRNTAPIYFARGHAYNLGKRQFDLAIADYNAAIDKDPTNMSAVAERGNCYYVTQEYDLAITDYNTYIDKYPNVTFGYISRANAYLGEKMYDSAIADYTTTIKINPNSVNAYTGRANAFVGKRSYELALQDFTQALTFDPNNGNAYNNRGLLNMAMGNYDDAVSDYKKAIAIDTKRTAPFAIINIIGPLAHLHRFSEAAGYYNDYKNKYPPGYIETPAWAFFKKYIEVVTTDLAKNDFKTALKNLDAAEKLYSSKGSIDSNDDGQKRGYTSILAMRGYAFEQLNKIQEAGDAYEEALLLNKYQPDIIDALERVTKKRDALLVNDNTPPTINILEPAASSRSIGVEDDKVAGTKQHIRGQAIDQGGIKSVMLNNKYLKVEENGYFDTVVDINAGVNVFTIVATDKNANSSSQSLQIVTGGAKDNANAAAPANQPDNSGALTTAPVYHAVLIAECDYADKNIPSLQGPKSDMFDMYNLLVNHYGFSPSNTDTLVNAPKLSILTSIVQMANAMGENDNLLIFYAGHGQMVTNSDNSEDGYLVPQDAVLNNTFTYLSSDELTKTIKHSKAQHILFIADACFAGQLFRAIPSASNIPIPVAVAYKDKSRKLLASGNRTVVPDKSKFVEDLRMALQENRAPYITVEQLIDSFRDKYTNDTHLSLQYYPIIADDLGGQFVFMRK